MNTLIVIGGPTAAGKTALAIRLAHRFHADIISADSRQFYREMNIGTAKPEPEELSAATHHLVNSLSIKDEYDTGRFERDALLALTECFKRSKYAILVGGSGLYLDAVVNGLDDLPGRNPIIREELENLLTEKGISVLQEELMRIDPEAAFTIDLNNPHRLIRAIELCRITGQSLSSLRSGKKAEREFKSILIAVSPDREILYRRIDARVTAMMERGLLEEVRSLWDDRALNPLKTVGYSELFEYLEGKISLEAAVALIQQHTRNYAKRQLTWFRNRKDYTWFEAENNESIIRFIEEADNG